MFFDDDICLCGNSEKCKYRNNCMRAEKKIGIHTYSLFYEDEKECKYYIKKKRGK